MRKLLLLALTLLLLCCHAASADEAQLTLMIYMTGSNLESEYFAATSDIQEMISSRYDQKQVNVLIMTGGSEKWWTPGISADHLSIHRIERAKLTPEKDYPLESMASPNPLTALLDYGHAAYPADKYALIIWDHGNGPVNGVCMDTLFGGDLLLPAELNAALAASPFGEENKLEWIGFDACLMANAETASLLAPYAKYMIASQETEPGRGWDYGFLKGIEADATGADTGRRIIDRYYDSAMTHTPGNNITLSLMDLGQIAAVKDAADAFFTALNMHLTAENFSELSVQRQSATGVGRAAASDSDYDLVDLRSLASHYAGFAEAEARSLTDALDGAVLYSRANIEGLSGLSVYHPYYNKAAYLTNWRTAYRKAALSDSYLRYLDTYTGIWLGEQLTSWKGMQPTLAVDPNGESQTISLQLTASQLQNYASAELLVFAASDQYGYGFLYREALERPDENGLLAISYDGRQLVHVDENGSTIGSSLSYYLKDSRIALGGFLRKNSQYLSEEKTMFAYFRPLGDDGTLEFLYLDEVLENGVLNSRHNVQLEDWDHFYVLYNNRVPTTDAEGEMLPFDSWEDSGWSLWQGLELKHGLTLRFSREQVLNSDYAAILQIKDTQGNLHVTPLIPLQHLKATVLDAASQVMLDDEHCAITLRSMEIVASALDPVIKLRVDILNKKDVPLRFYLDYMLVNQIVPMAVPAIDAPYGGVPAGETASATITIPVSALFQAQAARVDQLVLFGSVRTTDYAESWPLRTPPIALDYDFSSLVPLQEAPAVLTSVHTGDFTIELLDVRAGISYDNNALAASIRVTNHTDRDMELNLRDSRINRFKPWTQSCSVTVPAGATAYDEITFTNSHTLGVGSYNVRSFSEDMLSDMQIREVTSLTTFWNASAGTDYTFFDVRFDLPEAFPYEERRKDPIGERLKTIPLYECEDFSIRLAGLGTNSSSASVALELENHTDRNLTLTWESGGINGVTEEFWLKETDLPANTITLDYVNLLPVQEDLTLPNDLNSILLTGSLSYEDGDVLFRDSYQITVTNRPEISHLFYTDNLHAEVLSHEEDLYVDFLSSELIVPENPEQYRVRLSTLPQEPVDNAQAYILMIDGEHYIPLVRNIPLTRQEDGSWACDYSGMYVGWEGLSGEIWYIKSVTFNSSSEELALGSLVAINLDHGIFSCTDAIVTYDSTNASAAISYASADQRTAYSESYSGSSGLRSWTPTFLETRDDQGRLLAFNELYYDENIIWECGSPSAALPVQFALHPLADFPNGLYVLYSFTLPDGSGYSTEPIPYQQAATPAEN